jgi:hypothetical protein
MYKLRKNTLTQTVQITNCSGLFRVQVYSGFRFIQGSALFRVQVYSGFRFIQGSGLFRFQVYLGFMFI